MRNEITHRYPTTGTGFLRLAVIRQPLRSTKGLRFGFPLWQRKLVRNSTTDLEYAICSAMKTCLETPAGLLDTNPLPDTGSPQVVAVTIPTKPDALSDIVQLVRAILNGEEWWQAHKDSTSVLWGAVNFPDPVVLDITKPEKSQQWVARVCRGVVFLLTGIPRLLHRLVFGSTHRQKELYVTVTRLFPELGAMQRLLHILKPGAHLINGTGKTGHGFGMRQHQSVTPTQQNSHGEQEPVQR